MNSVVTICCALAALALLPAEPVRGVLATAAASLFGGTPFILAAALVRGLLRAIAPRHSRLVEALAATFGCGCGVGPSALSIPATVATGMVFGPVTAALRFCAGCASSALLLKLRRRCHPERCHTERATIQHGSSGMLLQQLTALLAPALIAGVVLHLFNDVRFDTIPAAEQWLAGAALGFAASPCALGAVALAASLHARAPFAASGMLCVSGVIDLRSLAGSRRAAASHDAFAFALLAAALGIVALRDGDALVNPRLVPAIACCAVAAVGLAVAHRGDRNAVSRLAPALMLLGSIVTAPAPVYTATETTLGTLFPGERLVFAGRLEHGADADVIVRFAITCCRADAAPVAVRLSRRQRYSNGSWLEAAGWVVAATHGLALVPERVRAIAPPADPFIYR